MPVTTPRLTGLPAISQPYQQALLRSRTWLAVTARLTHSYTLGTIRGLGTRRDTRDPIALLGQWEVREVIESRCQRWFQWLPSTNPSGLHMVADAKCSADSALVVENF